MSDSIISMLKYFLGLKH